MKQQWEEEWHSNVIETQTSQHAEAQEERITQILDRARSVRTQLVSPQMRSDLPRVLPGNYLMPAIHPDTIHPDTIHLESEEKVESIESNAKNSREVKL